MRIEWTAIAEQNKSDLIEFIAKSSLAAAMSQLNEIERQTDTLLDYPEIGREGRTKGTRELVVNRTSFIVVYKLNNDIQILRVLHGAQKWPKKLK